MTLGLFDIFRKPRLVDDLPEIESHQPKVEMPTVATEVVSEETPHHSTASPIVAIEPDIASQASASKFEWVNSPDPIYYVYLHRDINNVVFYVGIGHGDWAWQPKSGLWKEYLRDRSNGVFEVDVVEDCMYRDDASSKKDALLGLYAKTVVNMHTPHRELDYEALEIFHKKRKANLAVVDETRRNLESTDTDLSVTRYRAALAIMHEYSAMTLETGLVGEMMQGPYTDVVILDRLTLCLAKLQRFDELVREGDEYFARYPKDASTSVGSRILSRVEKAKKKL